MSKYINKVTTSLTKLISEISENPSLFVKNPKTDFTRNRKINFKKFIGITMNSGGGTMSFRIARFAIADDSYEMLVTNLERSEFSTNDLKEIYHLRWGIETSFREYLRNKRNLSPPDMIKLIEKYVLPVRPGRKDPRKVKPQASASFLYRVA